MYLQFIIYLTQEHLLAMDDQMMKHYQRLTEKIFSKPVGERAQYLEKIKNSEMEFFKCIGHLITFLTAHDEGLEKYAHSQIKQILDDLSKE